LKFIHGEDAEIELSGEIFEFCMNISPGYEILPSFFNLQASSSICQFKIAFYANFIFCGHQRAPDKYPKE
jgi:hypothetical protein